MSECTSVTYVFGLKISNNTMSKQWKEVNRETPEALICLPPL